MDAVRVLARPAGSKVSSSERYDAAEEFLWNRFFEEPCAWWDNRLNKRSCKHPDFKNASTGESLWIDSRHCPEWVKLKLDLLENPSKALGRGIWAQYRQDLQTPMKIKKSKSLASIPMLVSELKFCSSSRNLERGKELHAAAVRSGDHSNIYVASTLVDMYAKCSSMVEARRVFNGMISQDVVSWTSLILGYAQNGEGGLALELFQRMMKMLHTPDAQAFIAALKACSSLVCSEEEGKQETEKRSIKFRCLEKVMAVHSHAEKCGCDSHFKVASSLVDLYARCGSMSDARQVFEGMKFRNVVSWTALISGYAQNGQGQTSLELFQQMIRSEGCSSFQQVVETQNEISENRPGCSCAPNSQTFVAALKACVSLAENEEISVDERSVKLKSVEKGMAVHAAAARSCLSSDIFVGNSLIDMYSKCGSMADAQSVFDRMKLHTVVSWTALMLGYAHSDHPREALEVFKRLLQESQDCSPNSQTFAVAITACSSMADLGIGKTLHAAVCRRGFESELIVSNCLVDLYSKCGSVAAASEMFDSAGCRDIVTWNSLIAGYSRQGRSFERVWELFNRMQDEGFTPNSVTLVSVLTACSHAGLVEKGKECFRLMRSKFGIGAEIDHYHCMIDLLGRANQLDVAMGMVREMPYEPNAVTWATVLGACQKWKNFELGRVALEYLTKTQILD